MHRSISEWQNQLRELLLEELSIHEADAVLNLATARHRGRVNEVVKAYSDQLNEFVEEKSSMNPNHISIYGSQVGIDYTCLENANAEKVLHDLTAGLEDGWTYDITHGFITIEALDLTIEFNFGDTLEDQNFRDDLIWILRNHGGTVA